MSRPRNGKTFNCQVCGKEFYRSLSEIKHGAIKHCSTACYGAYLSSPESPRRGHRGPNANRKGQTFACKTCGKEFYRTPGQIKLGSTKTCSKACLSQYKMGKGNPFWGKSHTEKTKRKISTSRTGAALGNQHAKGYKHTEESKKRISEASKKLWKDRRDIMMASRSRGWSHANYKPPEERRYRKQFTPYQRKNWKDKRCAYCGTADNLELDHIIPIFDKGSHTQGNAQTLCRGCNLWKTKHVDLPRYHAKLAVQGGR